MHLEISGGRIQRLEAFGFGMRRKGAAELSPVDSSRGWWPLIRDFTAGAWQRNEEIHVNTVISNPTIYACVTRIAGDVSKLRPKLVEWDKADRIWRDVDDSSPYWDVLRKPNHYQMRMDFLQWWIVSKLLHGNTYALKSRDARGIVRALYILNPLRTKPLQAPDGSIFYELQHEIIAGVKESAIVPAREIIHDLCYPLFHELVGVSPLFAAALSGLQGLTARRMSERFFANGGKPGGVLTAPGAISQDTAQRIKHYWDTEFVNDNAGKIAVLGDGMKFDPLALTAEQSQLVEQLRMTDEDIAKCFHMTRHKVGIGPDPTYHNIGALNQQYKTDCIQVHTDRIEELWDEGLGLRDVPGKVYGVEFDADDLIKLDPSALMETLERGRAYITPNEGRRKIGLPPIEGGDAVYRQHQDYSIEALSQREQAPPSASGEPPPTKGILELVVKSQDVALAVPAKVDLSPARRAYRDVYGQAA